MEEKFKYLDTVDFAATVCDKEGIVLFQNERAIERDGDVMGKNLYNCHGEKAGQMIRHMIETGTANTYQIVRHGKHKLLHQTPWFDESGAVAGLIELAVDLPDNMPVFHKDNTEAPTRPVLNSHNKAEWEPAHTAEHILNQTMVRMFGCPRSKNAHIERKKSKCDYILEACPSDEQVAAIEAKVNEVIAEGLPVTIEFMDRERSAAIVDLSKLPEDASDILRIVRIGDYDTCACIGAHVKNTLEIGTFKILSHDFNDGVWRLRWKIV